MMLKKIYVIFLIFNIASVSMMTTTITAVTKNDDESTCSYNDLVMLNSPSEIRSFEMKTMYQVHMNYDNLQELVLEHELFTKMRWIYRLLNELKN